MRQRINYLDFQKYDKKSYAEIAPSDMYIYSIDFGNTMLAGKVILMK